MNMSKFPAFRVTIVGETMAELRARCEEFIGTRTVIEGPKVDDDQDFLTEAAARPAPIAARLPADVPSPTPTSTVGSVSNDYGVDSRGLLWDERIHSTTQGKNKDGTWRNRRNVEDKYVNQVEQELATKARNTQAQTMEHASPPPIAIPAAAPLGFVAPIIPFPSASPLIPVPVEAALPHSHTVQTFKQHLIPTLAKLVKEEKLNHEYINGLKKHFGVQELWLVNDEQLQQLFDSFVHYNLIVKSQ